MEYMHRPREKEKNSISPIIHYGIGHKIMVPIKKGEYGCGIHSLNSHTAASLQVFISEKSAIVDFPHLKV